MLKVIESPNARPTYTPLAAGKKRWRRLGLELLVLPVSLLLLVSLWALIARLGNYPEFILPHPVTVLTKLSQMIASGLLWQHTQATLTAMVGGLALGLSVATVLGYVLAKSPLLERLVGPYLVASQSIPAIAIAPLLIIWFGSGKLSKVLICALVVFFPVLVTPLWGFARLTAV